MDAIDDEASSRERWDTHRWTMRITRPSRNIEDTVAPAPIIHPEACRAERWKPGDDRPEIITDVLTSLPRGAAWEPRVSLDVIFGLGPR
jgi:hypothetical protein